MRTSLANVQDYIKNIAQNPDAVQMAWSYFKNGFPLLLDKGFPLYVFVINLNN